MNKQHLLSEIKKGIASREVSEAEVLQALSYHKHDQASSEGRTGAVAGAGQEKEGTKNSWVTKALYWIGGLITLMGVFVFLTEYWSGLGSFFRIFITLGLALIVFVSAFIVSRKPETDGLSQVLFAVSAALSPIGLFVMADEIGVSWDTHLLHSVVFFGLAVVFASALYASKKGILHIAAGVYFVWGYYAMLAHFLIGSGFALMDMIDIYAYSGMLLGVAYFIYGFWLRASIAALWKQNLDRIIGLFMTAAFVLFLGSALFLGGIWNLLMAFIIVGAVALSIRLRIRAGLIVSVLSIGAYLLKLSNVYFSESISFAFLLIFSGFLFMGLGYLTYYLSKKYIASPSR